MSDALQRIALNYMQLAALASRFPFHWPNSVQRLLDAHSSISTVSSFLNFQCFVNDPSQIIYTIYFKALLVSLLPPLYACFAMLAWRLKRRSITSPQTWQDRGALTTVVLLTLTYPTLCNVAVRILVCHKIGNTYWLQADLQEECFHGRHLVWLLGVSVPSLLLYAVGLPLAWLITAKRHTSESFRYRFFPLYTGYRLPWYEAVVAARKLAIILVAAFGPVLASRAIDSTARQASLAVLLIFFYVVLHLLASPFKLTSSRHAILDKLELSGLIVCFLTMWSGQVFSWSGIEKSIAILLSVVIICVNCLFVMWLLWSWCAALLHENQAKNIRGCFQRCCRWRNIFKRREIPNGSSRRSKRSERRITNTANCFRSCVEQDSTEPVDTAIPGSAMKSRSLSSHLRRNYWRLKLTG